MLKWPPFWAVSTPPVAALTKVLVIERAEELKIGKTTDALSRVMNAISYIQYAILFSNLLNIKRPTSQKIPP